ncbi:hypothetical protein CVT24_009729 [Panaeolus cyanescens]|uniref:Amidohydrolase 3 domain-containing protein n=1 Tax=Panaeolus cyanescens TaxID=181874 RepID=A0A409Y9H2_9AGAR|nr:hypothetical protein CVT24_009729 [Panaeolus cyanescens]
MAAEKNDAVVTAGSNRNRFGTQWALPWPRVLLAIAVLSVASYIPSSSYTHQTSALPDSYALCTKQGESIYVVDAINSQVQCIVVKDGIITDNGPLARVKASWNTKYPGSQLQVRYLPPGAAVVPGISDSHAHILEYGATQQLPLEGSPTVQDAVARVRAYILSTPDILNDPTKVVLGGGWDHTVWPNESWPTAADLEADPIIRGRPIVLQSKDCHALWVSSKAIEKSLPFPEEVEGGVIVRDQAGNPTGVLLDNAQELLKQPELTDADLLRRFQVTVRDAHAYGLTAIHDAGLDPQSLAFFKSRAALGKLPIRIYGMTFFDETKPYWGDKVKPLIDAANGTLTARSVKIFADGALRTGGAALYEPYADNPGTNGFMRLDPEVLFDVIPKFLKDGWQVNVHAIGDRANAIVIDAFESSLEGADVYALRPRLEHAQIMTKKDMARLGDLGVIASVQPTHAVSDMWYAQDRLGPERVKMLYAFRTLIESGARITLGSDAPVESLNPLATFYAAVTRVSPDGISPHGPGGWFPEQRLTRIEALRGITIDPAHASFTEDVLGSLEIGKKADFTVFSQDIMSIPEDQILSTKVLATVIDGVPVYGRV